VTAAIIAVVATYGCLELAAVTRLATAMQRDSAAGQCCARRSRIHELGKAYWRNIVCVLFLGNVRPGSDDGDDRAFIKK